MRLRLLVNRLMTKHGLQTFPSSPGQRRLLGTSCHLQQVNSVSSDSNGFLRESYYCHTQWNKRLESQIIKNISNLDDFFYDIDKRYQADKVISAIDVDLFANKVTDEENLDELEELIHRLRRSPASADALPSTSYAFIRALLKAGKFDDLLRILNDRWNYGVFMEHYVANILIDEFLKQGNSRDAAKVASLLMLEEDFGPPTTQYFALVACLTYLQNPSPETWETTTEAQAQGESEEEEVKVRLRYVRNPYFDDHFDLSHPNHLVGKTLTLLSAHILQDEVLATSIKALGLAHYGKWDRLEVFLNDCASKKETMAKGVVDKVLELCESALAEVEASPNKTLSKPKVHQFPGVNLDEKDVTKMWQLLHFPEQEKHIPKVKAILSSNKIPNKDLDLLGKAKELLSSALAEWEEKEITDHTKTFQNWEERRILELDNQMKRFRKFEVTESIDARKKELQEKEEVIFFFDNEEEWMMRLPPDEQKGYKLSTEYIPRNYEKFVRHVPPKKNIKKKKKD